VLEIFDINFALEYIESTQFNNLYNNIKNNKHLNLTIANKFAIAFVITFLAHIKEKRFNTETIKTILKIQQPYLRYNKFIGRNNSEIIIDSYNGSFLSMEKGIVDTCKNEKKEIVLVLGSMLELGNDSELYHTKLGRIIANQMNVCNVLLLGEGMLYAYFELKKANTKIPVKHFFDYNDLISALLEIELSDKKTIYIKGSGSMRMELIAPYVLSSFNDKEV
jgi:UDP-N-acetylmuramyl pentapeptide synthase